MDTSKIEEEQSDDETQFGKITIKKIKKMFRKGHRIVPSKYDISPKNEKNTSLRLIESHSQPNLRLKPADSPVFSSNVGSPALNGASDDSFIEMENIVSKHCKSPRTSDNVELNNTLEIMDFILSQGPNKKAEVKHDHAEEEKGRVSVKTEYSSPLNVELNNTLEVMDYILNHGPNKKAEVKHDHAEEEKGRVSVKTEYSSPLNVELNNTLEVMDYILNHGPNKKPEVKHDHAEEEKGRVSVKTEYSSPLNVELNNTLEVMDYILNHGPNKKPEVKHDHAEEEKGSVSVETEYSSPLNVELNNTLEVMDYILNHGPNKKPEVKHDHAEEEKGSVSVETEYSSPLNVELNNTLEVMDYILNHGPNKKPEVKHDHAEEEKGSVSVETEYSSPLNVELNNTLEVMDYILNHGPNKKPEVKHVHAEEEKGSVSVETEYSSPLKVSSKNETHAKETVDKGSVSVETEYSSPLKVSSKNETPAKETITLPVDTEYERSPNYITPANSVMNKPSNAATPSSSRLASRTPLYKTPANPTLKKPFTPRLTPGRSNAYQHISSPIALYIKNCPQVPLVKNVHPKKPLPGSSSIPKFNTNPSHIQINKNKENINLPAAAYKSAKKTKVIQLPDENKLPQSSWVKKMTSPRPTVMKHEKREGNPVKTPLLPNNEDSIANLSCNQAEVSVCTEKTALPSTNKR